MAQDSIEAALICENAVFMRRIQILLTSLVTEVLGESPDVPFHNTRARWASRFSARSKNDVEKACMVVALVPAVTLDSTDAELIPILRTHLNVFAGAFNPAPDPVDGLPQEVIITETDHDDNPNTPPRITRTFKNLFGLLR